MQKRFFLLDASSYLFRAYYAMRPLSNSKGLPTHAIYGFMQMVFRLLKDEKPDLFWAVFDRPEPTFRKQAFEAYKAQRSEMPEDLAVQIPWIKKLLKALGIPLFEKAGFEADDILGTLVKRFENEAQREIDFDLRIVVVTGDKDLMQLVSDRTWLLDTMRMQWCQRSHVIERFGVPPESVIDILGLAGDSVDNIPGVPGIGEKTATQLIAQFGSIEKLYEQLEQVQGKRKELLQQYQPQALLSKQLATIHCEVPLDELLPVGLDLKTLTQPTQNLAELIPLLEELEFSKWLEEVRPKSVAVRSQNQEYQLVNTVESLDQLVDELSQVRAFAFDTETNSLNSLDAKLVGLALSTQAHKGFYLPIAHLDSETPQLPFDLIKKALQPFFLNPSLLKIAQNLKFDWAILKRVGIEIAAPWFDTMMAAYLLDSSGSHGLDHLALQHLQHKTISYQEVTDGKKDLGFEHVPIARAVHYSAEDAEVAYRLYELFQPQLHSAELKPLFEKIEMPLIPILFQMEATGIKLDFVFLQNLKQEFEARLLVIEARVHELAGEKFNLNSSKQLAVILFEKLQLPVQKKTKTGYSTDVEVLTVLASLHELPRQLLEYRTLSKLQSTYIEALLSQADPVTHRIHTSFNQNIAETGRLSSSNPNLQNIPIRSEEGRKIRQAFIAEQGHCLLSADYSQIELRLLAHLSDDQRLIEAFHQDHDIHRQTAAAIFKISEVDVNQSQRAAGKTVNFAVIYGQGPYSLSQQLGISQAQAKEYIEEYFMRYQRVKEYREEVLKQARQTQCVRTLYGRLRKFPEINSKNMALRSMAERMAFNTVIQGTAADLIKIAMIDLSQSFQTLGLRSKLLLQVHDELLFEVPQDETQKTLEHVRLRMENAAQLKIPLKVDVRIGKSWGELKE